MAIQFAKAVTSDEDTFLATLKYEEPREKEIDTLLKVLNVLETFSNVMPRKLLSKLPPKRVVDHKIKLVPKVKPPARAPYQMSPPELKELRKYLNELIDASFIKPSKVPYGASVLFQCKHNGSL